MQSFPNKDKKKNKIIFFLIVGWLEFFYFFYFFWIEVRAFKVVVLKFLTFSIKKSYFIYFTTSLYNTPDVKCSIFF